MINRTTKNIAFLILLLIIAYVFYAKSQTVGLIIMGVFILFFALYVMSNKDQYEHLNTQSEMTEAVQNLASLYNSGTLTATNLHLTGNLTVDGASHLGGSNTYVSVDPNGSMSTKNLTVDGNISVSGNIAVSGGSHFGGTSTFVQIDQNGNLSAENITADGNIYLPEGHSLVVGKGSGSGVGFSSGDGNLAIYKLDNGTILYGANLAGSNTYVPNSAPQITVRGISDFGIQQP